MSLVLQKTKLFIPPARDRAVERPRLLERLDGLRGADARAALLCAPAGSGKTTLVGQWLGRQELPAAWLALDERDNLPARFFAYLLAALQAVAPGAGRQARPLLELPGASADEIVALLANDLLEAPGPFVLVLDDFHAITNPLLHRAVDLLIEAQPPHMRLALLSREDPAIQMARRRARGELVEIRQADLAFTREEAAEFFRQGLGLPLAPAQVDALEARTEGWAAGLQMAALALQSPPGGEPAGPEQAAARVDRFLQDFSGSHHFILDFLVEEVLERQPAEVQSFLLETAVLDRLQAGLCAAVTGQAPAQSQVLLERISRANLFVVPLDAERRWFRYHHLFGDLLLARLRAERPHQVAGLYLRASGWYAANGDPRLAVEYALQAGDHRRAADLLERHLAERWQTVDLDFFRLAERLPFEAIAERPALCLQSAWLWVMFGQTGRILPLVEAAERALNQGPPQPGGQPPGAPAPSDPAADLAFARTLRAYLADLRNQPVALDESLERACAAIPETNPGMRNSVAVIVGTICYMEGDFAAALRYFEDALALDRRVDGTNAVPIATARIALVLTAQGRLREAMRRLGEAEAYARERGIRRFYISGALHQRMAEILLEWNRLDEAGTRLAEGLRLLEDWPVPSALASGLALLARLRTAQGDLPGAREALARADGHARQTGLHPHVLDALERARLDLLLAAEDRTALEAWARENDACREQSLSFRYEARQAALCRAWLALGRGEEAARLLERLEQGARGRAGSRTGILALLAAARAGAPEQALAGLEEALRLGEPEGYLRTFLEAGPPLAGLLRVWLQRGPARADPRLHAYAQTILAAFERPAPTPAPPAPPAPDLPEPLSPREQEVLGLLGQGLSNQQIAARLVISVRTVKKHVENIHGKLGVQNRTQAVARARALGLLP